MISPSEVIFRLLLAGFLGGIIGLERERKSWFAGLRTHMLVCIGSTLTMIVSQFGFNGSLENGLVIVDPSRVASQVVSGISFLGAGTILFWKNKIKGLTTAASLWTVAAIGLSIGGGLYFAAIITTALIIFTLALLKPLESRLFKTHIIKDIAFFVKPSFSLVAMESLVKQSESTLINLQVKKNGDKNLVIFTVECHSESSFLRLLDDLKSLPDVDTIESAE